VEILERAPLSWKEIGAVLMIAARRMRGAGPGQ
jgi:hypothetical protein